MMMSCEFTRAKDTWNGMRDQIQTDIYKRFVKERLAMADWCVFLFARFHTDLVVTSEAVEKPLKGLGVGTVTFPDGKEIKDADLKASDDPYRFALSKLLPGGIDSWGYALFPMDWVHSSIFHIKGGEPRWVEVTPEIRFALGCFCFETKQYADAEKHFTALLQNGDEKYTAAARSLQVRAAKEAKARAAYEALLKEFAEATTAAQATAVKEKVNAYPAQYDGTLVWLDVMDPSRDEVKVDFYPADAPEVPPSPPPPQSRGG
jgi:hypothetical protein